MLVMKMQILVVFALLIVTAPIKSYGAVLELGESQLHGKKDQPEAMTFVSRAPLDISLPVIKWKATDKIKQAINSEIFELTLKDDN